MKLADCNAVLICLAGVLLLSGCARTPASRATRGTIDLTSAAAPARIDGEWEFSYGELVAPGNDQPLRGYLQVPGVWNDHPQTIDQTNQKKGFGFATLRLRAKLPSNWDRIALKVPIMSTAYRLWLNGELVAENGRVSTDPAAAKPENRPLLVTTRTAKGKSGNEITILVHVSNYHMHKGGMRLSVHVGPEDSMLERERRQHGLDLFITGSLTIVSVYHLFLFLLRREEKSLLIFAVFCATIALRTILTGERSLTAMWPGLLSWETETRLDFITICVSPVLLAWFLNSIFRAEIADWLVHLVSLLGGAGAMLVLIFPAHIYAELVQWLLQGYILFGIYCFFRLGRAAFARTPGAKTLLAGFFLLLLAFTNDVLYASGAVNTMRAVPLGLFAFVVSQSFLLSIKFNREYRQIQGMSKSMARFVPVDFLRLLGRDRIEDVRLGDQSERVMTVLFSDLRGFTGLSETMSPAENFALINETLKRLGPVIREHGGFIDKYIGDAIMALFPGAPESAVDAAVAMQQKLAHFNVEREKSGLAALQMGIGINTGRLMLGTVGEEQRIEGTVISDAVNTAARLETESKTFGAGILVSQATMTSLDPGKYKTRMLGQITVKGKSRATTVFEIYSSDNEVTIEEKNRTRAALESAINTFLAGQLQDAHAVFERLAQDSPTDRAIQYYRDLSKASNS